MSGWMYALKFEVILCLVIKIKLKLKCPTQNLNIEWNSVELELRNVFLMGIQIGDHCMLTHAHY